ncbi:3-oxoacyl-[acyl-carrier-protein] synthase-3 [Desulfocicer vacuolatum DSM 3385]|uniref:3-oxoacyl-[acyl-carrier-protein] synthase-3 n=1 Tax=Desulfocicer vacuolatum DSM 3385 TaxID=1121400 RepID=A0A1W2AFG3_9BACT|nr:3-oxoacyl-ACP synthase III [Desulfocicer vacuolatum]SMC59374.1 3-oxoacyl-[acyl-carrier-protein] synthase-3 [Desulfocicer vacuolatum DSM 3385]
MKYSKVYIDALGYELAPNVITTDEIEKRLEPFYTSAGFKMGQLEVLTGIKERRFWDVDHTLAQGSAKAGQKALTAADVSPDDIGALVFCGVGRDGFEPATACAVADALKISNTAHIYDVSNACLGMITGMVEVANAIELGQIRAGLVVSCETARQIVDATIDEINREKTVEFYSKTIATMTGGAGAAAVLLTDGTLGNNVESRHTLKGGVVRHDNRFHDLCRWTFNESGMPTHATVRMRTNAHGVLENGLALARQTFEDFTREMDIPNNMPDKFICHQVGSTHQKMFHKIMNIDPKKDYSTFPYLGNMGTVSLPMTAAIAHERGFLKSGDYVGFMGIGSGLNCLMMGIEW